ncbi:MAG: TonB-dependent receptor [Bacteroidales bacterium]|nr:TonB-dependent receptor [Bacteroidales bacterium]
MEKRKLLILIIVALLPLFAVAQSTVKVSGKVTDNFGNPIPGATVMVSGTTTGTITDQDGQYTLEAPSDGALVAQFIGFDPEDLSVNNQTTINFMLFESNTELEELVVIGYGTMKKKDVTSSITTISAKELNKGVFTDPGSMLQGKVAGLVVTSSGDPNGSPSITLRGASSLRKDGGMSPYYVVDGIPGVDISMVAPDDIESIDVLRDATATAIYGSKAANGVIIITTKSGGNSEHTNVVYNGYVAIDNISKKLEMASASDIRDYVKKNGIDYAYDKGQDTNWQDEVLRTGVSHNHNVSINGGSEKTKYMASINYQDRQGVIDGTHMNRLNVRSLLSTKVLKDHLELSAGVNSMYAKHVGVNADVDGASVLDAMNYFNPTTPIKNEDGGWSTGDGSSNYNPLSMINEDTSETIWKRNQVIAKASLNIFEDLHWNTNYSFDNYQETYSEYHSHDSQLVPYNAYNGAAKRKTYFGHNHTFETYVNYDKTIEGIHKLALMAGYSWEERIYKDGFGLTVHNFFDDYLKWNQLSYAGVIDGMKAVESGTKETVRNISFYGRASYSFNSRYMLQVTIRRDGSSVFADGHRWGTFPSVSAAWNITDEDFMANQNVLSNLKLRVGYGISGNAMGFGAYSGVATYGSTGEVDNNYAILAATKLANSELTWETTGMFNVGFDYGFWGSRINGSIEFYNKKTKDLIWEYPVSTVIYPIDKIQANVGEITNTGFEFTVNVDAVRTEDFDWMTTLNLSHNKNTVDKLSNDKYQTSTFSQGDPRVAGVSANGYTQRIMEGEALGTFFLFEYAGSGEDGKATYYVRDENGNKTGETTNEPEYKDRYIAGNAQPKLNLGWNNTLTYKNWNMNLFFTGVFGNKIYNGSRAHYTAPDFFSGGKNVLKEFITDRDPSDNLSNIPSDRFLEKGDYFRLQTISLGYTFEKFDDWIQSLQLYVTCNNVFTITGYKGLDPEVNLGGIDPGVDYRWNNYPHARTVMIGAKVNF